MVTGDLILVSDVAGDVGGDREILEKARINLAQEDDTADAEEYKVLELLQKLQNRDLQSSFHFLTMSLKIPKIRQYATGLGQEINRHTSSEASNTS